MYQAVREMWKGFAIDSVSKLEEHLDNFRILFAFHSGKIENEEVTYHDTREIFVNGRVSSFTGDPRALFETQNQKLCYEYLKERIVAKEPITLELVREVHRILTSGTYDARRYIERGERAGEFKKHDYVTGILEVGSPPDAVEADIGSLLDEINGYRGGNPTTVAAYFHARFEYVHPFADGNGRVGRTLLNYFLMINNEPPVVIHEDGRKEYYAALECYDRDEDIFPLRRFLECETVRTWENTLERAQNHSQRNDKCLKDME